MNWDRVRCKPGVIIQPQHMKPEIHEGFLATVECAPATGDGLVWFTSLNDGRHKRNSKHYDCEAADTRCWNIKAEGEMSITPWESRLKARAIASQWTVNIADRLGPDYDVLFEEHWIKVRGMAGKILVPHIHWEWDPK